MQLRHSWSDRPKEGGDKMTKEHAMLMNLRHDRFYILDGQATLIAAIKAAIKDGGE